MSSKKSVSIQVIGLEEENKYLKLTILALRDKLEETNIMMDESIQAEKRRSANEVNSLKSLVTSIRDELESERINRDELIQKASQKTADENLQLKNTVNNLRNIL